MINERGAVGGMRSGRGGFEPEPLRGKPGTNRLSYGTTQNIVLFSCNFIWRFPKTEDYDEN
jgi:hypothetical protein